jgi:hypothetical protein
MGKRSGQLDTVLDDLSKSASRTRKTFSKNKSAVWVNHRIGIHWKYLSSSRSPSPVYAGIFLLLIKTASKPPKDRGDSQIKAFFLATLLKKSSSAPAKDNSSTVSQSEES